MAKKNKKSKKTKQVSSPEARGPGRPQYTPTYPKAKKWTLADFCVANGVNPETGKGPNCSKLTLIKNLTRGLSGRNSLILQLDEYREPNHESGLGRKCNVYSLREKANVDTSAKPTQAPKSARTAKPTKKPAKVTSTTAEYEATKARLLAPETPAPVTVPAVKVVTPTPAPAETPVPAPAETPTPAAETSVAAS
jgi:hypothetical protein